MEEEGRWNKDEAAVLIGHRCYFPAHPLLLSHRLLSYALLKTKLYPADSTKWRHANMLQMLTVRVPQVVMTTSTAAHSHGQQPCRTWAEAVPQPGGRSQDAPQGSEWSELMRWWYPFFPPGFWAGCSPRSSVQPSLIFCPLLCSRAGANLHGSPLPRICKTGFETEPPGTCPTTAVSSTEAAKWHFGHLAENSAALWRGGEEMLWILTVCGLLVKMSGVWFWERLAQEISLSSKTCGGDSADSQH